MDDDDYALALKLQKTFYDENSNESTINNAPNNDKDVIVIDDDYKFALNLQNELNGSQTGSHVTSQSEIITDNAWELLKQFDKGYSDNNYESSNGAMNNDKDVIVIDDDYKFALKLQNQLNSSQTGSQVSGESEIITDNSWELLKQFDKGYSDSNYKSSNKAMNNDNDVIVIDDDYKFALKLQDELNGTQTGSQVTSKSGKMSDNSLELLDPNPDVFSLFVEFDRKYFWGKLASVEVSWSSRMTLCAGVCEFHGHKSGICKVKLSEPLLKLRPRKDLLETLLHEMIHAYLFLTKNDRDRDGHGPDFQMHMKRLNKETGLNITIYHNFHDEVAVYQQHWWQCDGPCRKQAPWFGQVKRSMNRAPSANDPWWMQHKMTCGGTYHKIKEPENYGDKKRKLDDSTSSRNNTKVPKIDSFFNPINKPTTPINSTNKALTNNKSSNIHTLSDISNTSTYKPLTFNGDQKTDTTPKLKINFINRDEGLARGLIGKKRKPESSTDETSSGWLSSAKVRKVGDDEDDDDDDDDELSNREANDVDLSDFWNGSKSKPKEPWPASFPSELKINSLEEGMRQLRNANLKVGETIVIPNFISVTSKACKKKVFKKLIMK